PAGGFSGRARSPVLESSGGCTPFVAGRECAAYPASTEHLGHDTCEGSMRTPHRRLDSHTRPLLTLLEDRSLPTAGLAVNLSGGILRVTDYHAADTIAVHQTASGIVLDAAGDHQTYAGVSRVLI